MLDLAQRVSVEVKSTAIDLGEGVEIAFVRRDEDDRDFQTSSVIVSQALYSMGLVGLCRRTRNVAQHLWQLIADAGTHGPGELL